MSARRDQANQLAFKRLTEAEPVLVGVEKAGKALPGMKPNMVLTSGALLPWNEYVGPQKMAILYGALFEGLAGSVEEAEEKIERGDILVAGTHEHGCVGTGTGIYTASMSVFVVEDRKTGARGHCNFFEGDSPRRLQFGQYDDSVAAALRFVEEVLAPTIGEAIRRLGGIPLVPHIRRAVHLGDELHARATAGTLLFTRALFPAFLDMAAERGADVRKTLAFLETGEYSFLRVALSTAKALTDSLSDIEGSSLVTAMSQNCVGLGIKVSGLEGWHNGPWPRFDGTYFRPDVKEEDCGWFGADSNIMECVGLGAFAAAAAPTVAMGSVQRAVERNQSMYSITVGEHPEYKIPYLNYRGVPVGIDLFKVLETGITPGFHGILPKRDGTAVFGAGVLWPPIECFQAAAEAYRKRYGE